MADFTDIYVSGDKEKVFCYRTEKTVYEETLTGGHLVSSGWNGAGFPQNVESTPTRLDTRRMAEPEAFQFEAGGSSVSTGWEFDGFTAVKSTNENGAEVLTGRLSLKNTMFPVAAAVVTELDGTGILARHLEIRNTGDRKLIINRIAPISGGLEVFPAWQDYIPGGDSSDIYSLGYMEYDAWAHEGAFRFHKLPAAGYSVYGRWENDRCRHPMFLLKNNALGTMFTAQLAWSDGYAFDFLLHADSKNSWLSYKIRLDGPSPYLVLDAGESFETPAVHIGMMFGDIDDAVNEMHRHLRRSVFTLPAVCGMKGWLEAGIGPECMMDREGTKHHVDTAVTVGAEAMIIDAGWYCPPGTELTEWPTRIGDWYPDPERYPNGFDEIRDYIHSKGLLFGLWLDAERAGEMSRLYAEHPGWLMHDRDGDTLQQLDLTNPEAAEWVEEEIARVLTDYKVDLFRLDHNGGYRDISSFVTHRGERECAAARYYTAVYRMYERLRRRFPDVVFENCAGGGGRTDIGLVSKFTHTWVSDWNVAPRSAVITNGMTMALPPEYVDRLVSSMGCHTRASLDFMLRHTLFGRPTTNVYNPAGSVFNFEQIETVRHAFDIYKNFIRPFAGSDRIYHHTPEKYGEQPQGSLILERCSESGDRGVIGVFRLAGPVQEEELTVRPRGIDISGHYEITYDNRRQSAEADGNELYQNGFRVRLAGPMTSELILYRKLGPDEK